MLWGEYGVEGHRMQTYGDKGTKAQKKSMGHVSEPMRLAKAQVQVMGHKAESRKKQNALPCAPFKELGKVQQPSERFLPR